MPEPKKSNRLRELLHQAGPIQPSSTERPPAAVTIAPPDPYPLSTRTASHLIELPQEAEGLGPELQEIARHYITARRRTGEAILEAAGWLAQARARAAHGEWLLFLHITGTSPDTAEQLLHIADRASELPAFADAVRRGWLNQTAAAIAAKPSTPVEVITKILAQDEPPTVQEVQRERRAALAHSQTSTAQSQDQIPNNSVFTSVPQPSWLASLRTDLSRTRRACAQNLAGISALDDTAAADLRDDIEQLLITLAQMTTALEHR